MPGRSRTTTSPDRGLSSSSGASASRGTIASTRFPGSAERPARSWTSSADASARAAGARAGSTYTCAIPLEAQTCAARGPPGAGALRAIVQPFSSRYRSRSIDFSSGTMPWSLRMRSESRTERDASMAATQRSAVWKVNLVASYSLLYGINMYFQSFGSMSIIKVKAYWFHVRERGVFGAIFGTLISFGVYFAFDWGKAIVDMAKANPKGELGWLHGLIQKTFALNGKAVDATWAVFFTPAGILLFWALLDWWLIKDTPEDADFPHFDPHDASSGVMHIELTTMDLLKKVFASPLMLMIAMIGLTSGVMRNGIMTWYFIFAKEVKQTGAEYIDRKSTRLN